MRLTKPLAKSVLASVTVETNQANSKLVAPTEAAVRRCSGVGCYRAWGTSMERKKSSQGKCRKKCAQMANHHGASRNGADQIEGIGTRSGKLAWHPGDRSGRRSFLQKLVVSSESRGAIHRVRSTAPRVLKRDGTV